MPDRTPQEREVRARVLVLFSGGLDSILSVRALIEAGVRLEAVHFITPFTGSAQYLPGEKHLCQWGVKLRRVVIGLDEYLPLITEPRYGLGRALNPCIDCKILFLRKAKEIAESEDFCAIATGSVVGERPMSQNRQALDITLKATGLEGKLLHPLTALLLAETEAEKKGLIDRGKLFDISGRGRKRQFELAERWGIDEYQTPSGGCLLTEPLYASKLQDLLDHPDDLNPEQVALLKTGRHFRSPEGPKLIVGRDSSENERLLAYRGEDRTFFDVPDVGSPIGLLLAREPSDDAVKWAAGLVARYADVPRDSEVAVKCWRVDGDEREVVVTPPADEEIESWRL